MFDPSVFFPAFAAAGMTRSARFVLAGGTEVALDVGYFEPSQDEFEHVTTERHQVEYPTDAAPLLAMGDAVVIDETRTFKVAAPPQRKGDGTFSVARLVPA